MGEAKQLENQVIDAARRYVKADAECGEAESLGDKARIDRTRSECHFAHLQLQDAIRTLNARGQRESVKWSDGKLGSTSVAEAVIDGYEVVVNDSSHIEVLIRKDGVGIGETRLWGDGMRDMAHGKRIAEAIVRTLGES